MNHIYKVVFCRATGTFVAVAEYAKAQGKKGGNTVGSVDERSEETSLVGGGIKFAYTSLVSASLMMVGGQAMATPVVGNSATCFYDVTSQSVVCGDGTTNTAGTVDSKQAKAVVMGIGSTNTGESSIVIGATASSAGTASVAMGNAAKAGANQAVALGQNAQANGQWDISIGRQAGWGAKAPKAMDPKGNEGRNIAFGDGALKNGLDVNNNTVLGTSAGENLVGSHNIIMGSYSNTENAIESAVSAGSTEKQIGVKTREVDTVDNKKRQVKYIESNNSVAIGHRALATGAAGVAVGQQAKAFDATTVAVGNGTRAMGNNAVAMGNTANAGAGGAIAIGQQANYQPEIAENPQTGTPKILAAYKTTGANSIAIGVRTNATSNHSIAMGTEAKALAQGAVAVGSESNTSGVNATAIGQASEAKGKNSFAAGNDAHAVGTSAVAVGDGAGKGTMTIEEYKAGNYTNAASGDSSTAVGVYTKAKGAGSTAIGLSANAQTTRSVAVGAESSVAANQGIAIGDTAQVIEKGLESYWDTNTKSYKLRDSVSVGAMAVGSIAKAQGYGSVAVGRSSETVFMNSTAVGHVAKALGYNSTAMGFEAMAKGVSSVAIGDKALAGTQDPVTHLPINSRGVAIGVNSNATGETAVTIGSNADVRVSRGTALGVLSQVTQRDGVALGSNSIANRSEGVAGVDPLNAKNASAPAQVWTATHAAVSVGNDTKHTGQRQGNSAQIAPWEIPVVTRQITNVAAGSQDTDAVNVAQLRAAGFVLATAADTQAGGVATTSANTSTDNKIVNGETLTLKAGKGVTLNQDGAEVTITTDLSKSDKTHYFSVNHENTLQGVGNNYNNDGATGRNALAAGSHAKATGEESTAIGHNSSAEGKQSVAVGYKAKAKGEHALAIGDVAEAAQWGTAVGYGSRAEGVGSPIAIGTNSQTIGGNSPMAIGDWATANGSGAIAIGSKIGGAHEADKSTFAQGDKAIALGYLTKATQRDAMALGAETSATAESTVAIGKKAQATDSNSISIGRQSGSAGIDLDNKGANNNADITSRTKAGKTNANGLVNVTSIGNEAGSGTINNNYGVNIGYQAGSGGYNSYYGEGVSIGNKAGGVDKTNATVKTAMEAFSAGQGATDNTIITGNTNTAISSRAGVNALGHDNVAIGKDAGGYSSGSSNIAIGRHAGRASKLNTPNNEATRVIDGDVFSNARNTISMGEWANASSDDATAVGRLASASGASSMALGHQATAKPEKSVAIGYNARAVGTETSSISIGENAYNNASGALVIGKDASAKGFADVLTTGASPAKALPYNAIAIGKGANVDTLVGTNGTQERSTDAIAIGTDAKANYASTIAIGYGAKANTKSSATAIGLNSDAQGWKSLAVGVGAVAKQTDSVALGSDSVADIGFNEVGTDPLNAKEDGTIDSPIWKSTKAAVSVGNINHADPNKRVTRQITSVAAGTQDTDAVNVAQLKAAGFKLTTSKSDGEAFGSDEEKVKNGDTVTIDAGKNIKVTQTGSKVSIATKDNVTFNSVEVGNVYIDEANDDIIGLSNTFLGDDNFAADGRAATEEQLNETQDNLVRVLGGNAKNNDGTVSTNNIGGTGKHTIDEAVQFVHDKTATTPLTIEGNKVAPLDPANTNKLVTAGDIANAINNTGFTLTTMTTNDGELGANSTNNQLIKAGDTVTVEADNNIKITQADGKISVATKNDVKFDSVVAGGTKLDGNGLSFVNNDGTAVTNSPSISKTGINAGNQKISNVADGVIAADSKDAVNGGQLHAVKTTAESKLGTFTVGTDKNATAQGITVDKDKARFDIVGADNGKVMTQVDGNKIAVDLTADAKNSLAKADSALQSIQVKANGTDVTTLDKDNNTLDITQGDNITVSNDGGKVKVALNQDVTGLNSLTSKTITAGEGTNQVILDNTGVKVGGKTYISDAGLNANNKKVTNVADGAITATSKDAINGSQLHTVSTATKNLMGGNATVNADGTVTASNIGGTNANTIDDAIKTVKTTVKSTDNSIKVTTNPADTTNGTVFDISVNAQGLAESAQLPVVYTNANGEKVYKQTDGSFNTQADGQGSQVLANDVVASMQNGTGSTTVATKLTNIANGDVSANSKDAVNGSQLFATNQNVTNNANAITGLQNQTFKLQANGDTATAVKASDTVQFLNGDNIAVTRNANDITIATKKDVKFDSVTTGNTTVNNEGVTIKAPATGGTTDVKLTANGLDNGGNKITNVADGVIAADSKDAVNGGQLHAVKTTAESKLGAFTVGTDKNATAQGITVDKDKARFDIVGADNGKVMTQVDGNKIAVDLTADAKDSLAKADSALQSIQVKANGTDVTTLGKDNNTLDITQGDNITVSNDGGKVKVALNQDVAGLNSLTSKTITAGEGTNQVILDNTGVKVGGKTYISDAGLNANNKKVTNVADGAITATSKDAVNGSQLHTVSTATKNLMGGNATVNTDGTVTASNIGGTNANTIDDAIKTVKTTVKSTDNSIKVTANTADATNGTVFDISVNAQGLAESAQLPVVYTNANGTKVYKVGSKFFDNKEGTGTEIEATNIIASMQNADGTITPTTLANIKAGTKDTDAVNVSQLKGVADTLGGGASINADGTINAPTYNITNPADGAVIKAQNVGDALNALNTAVNNPLTFAGDTGLFNRNLGQTTTIKGGVIDENKLSNSNIGVVAKDGTLDIKLAKDITIDSVTTGNTTVNNEGVTIKAPAGNNTVTDVKLTANGLNNGGNKITNVADGEVVAGSKDAVNGGQLFNIKQDIVTNATNVAKGLSFAGNTGEFNSQLGDKVTVSGGLNDASITSSNTNIRTVAKDGKVDIQFADAPVFTGKVSAKGLDAGNQKITGVLAGDDKTDAVNVEQLSKALANVTVANQSLVQANSPFSYINKAGEQLVRKVAVVNGKSVVTFEKAKDGSIYTGDDITITALNPTDPQTTIPTLIGNVKAGINDNDVVNVSQLKGVAEVLGAGATVDADGSIKKPSYTVTGNTYNNVGGALQALNSEVEKPFTFIDDNGEKIARKLGENITVKGGATSNLTKNNIGVVANPATGELNVQLAETVNLGQNGSVAMGDSVINHAGLTIKSPIATNPNNTVSLTANGLNNGGNKISHVADGLIAKDSKDAVNGGQLSAVKDVADSALQTIKVKANGTEVKELTKDNNELNIKGDSNITVTNDNGEVKVDLADVITVGSPNNATGATNNPIKIDGEKGTITGLTNKDLTAADFAKAGRAATEEQLKAVNDFVVKYDTDPTSGNPNKDSVTFAGTPATPAIKAVDDKFTMAGGTVLNNVASAGDYTQAVNAYKATNAGDLNNAVIDVTNKGLKFAGNVGNEFIAKLGTTVGIKGGMVENTPTSATSGDNVITRTDNHGNINIELAKNAKFDSVITGSTKIDNNGLTFVDNAGKPVANSPSISQTGINAGNQRITGVLAGDDKTDAVNVEQLSKALANITVTNQSIVQANSPFSYVNTAGEQLIREVKTVNGKKEVAFKKAKDGTAYTGDDITIAALNPADPQTTLPTTIGNVKAGVQANDAVNVSQLKDMVTALGGGASIQDDGSLKAPEYTIHKTDGQAVKVNNVGDAVQALNNEVTKPLTFIGDNGEKVTRKLGENITVKGGATGNLTKNNIGIVANPATGELNVQLAETVNLGQNGSVAMGNTLVNNTGITVGDKVALTNTGLTTGDITVNAEGINAGNKAISNVANGVNANDAVNVSQLKAVQDSMKTASVNAGSDAITVSKTTNGNNTDYTIDLANSTKADIAKGVDAKNAVDTKGLIFTADAGKTTAKKLGDSIAITGDKNISTNATADGVKVSLNENIAVKEVKADTSTIGSVTINNAGINMGEKQITGLASGLNGKTLEDIKADLTAPERSNAATVGDLATVQNNVTNITNHYNTIIGGTNKDGQVLDANGKPIQDNTGKNIDVADALKTYNVQDNKAKTDNTIITAIKNMNEGGIKFFHVNDGTGEQNVEGSDIHQEDSTASGSYAAAVGYQAKAIGKNANAMGKDAQALGDNSMAFGTGNIVRGNNSGAFGDPSIINGSNSYSIGNNNRIGSTTNNAFALGNDVYLGADASGNDTTSVNGAVALGNKASVTVAGGVALGENSVANRAGLGSMVTTNSGDNVDASKNQVYALAEASDKDKKAIIATAQNSASAVSVGKEGANRQITNVAAGSADSDAVNVAQLKAVARTLPIQYANTANEVTLVGDTNPDGSSNSGPVKIQNLAAGTQATDAVNVSQLAMLDNKLDNAVNQLGYKLGDVEKNANAGISAAMATAALPQAYISGKSMVSGGMASYNGQGAVAFGMSKLSDNGRWVIKISGTADTQGNAGGSIGAGFHW